MFIIISILLVLTSTCDTSYHFDYSNCDFHMNYVDDSCNAFNFTDCSWRVCNKWDYIRGVPTCNSYITQTISDWNTCTQKCCRSNSDFPRTKYGIDQCQ